MVYLTAAIPGVFCHTNSLQSDKLYLSDKVWDLYTNRINTFSARAFQKHHRDYSTKPTETLFYLNKTSVIMKSLLLLHPQTPISHLRQVLQHQLLIQVH